MAATIIRASKTCSSRSWAASSTAPANSKHADIGISLPGTGELPTAPVYIDGKKVTTLRGADIGAQFKAIVEEYVKAAVGQLLRSRSDEVTVLSTIMGVATFFSLRGRCDAT